MGWLKGSVIGAITFIFIAVLIVTFAFAIGGWGVLIIALIGYPWTFMESFQSIGEGNLSDSVPLLAFFVIPVLINLIIFTFIGGLIGFFTDRKK